MKVQFIDPKGDLSSDLRRLGYSPTADFHLKPDTEYLVYGISMWRSVLHYLIIPTSITLPNWLPADLFVIVDPTIPEEWYFRYLGSNYPSEIKIIMGYKEIALNDDHYFDLIEREQNAVQTFLRRKNDMEKD